MEWKNILRGMMMGITDLVPGISGGTIAVILGIYDRLLEAISGFFSREWKRHIGFLVPLAIGMGTAILVFSRIISYCLGHYYEPTQFFFLGLIIGVLPFLLRQSDARRTFAVKHVVLLIIGVLLMASLAFLQTNESAEPIADRSLLTMVGLFFSGWLASMAMLLPGISGSFVLLVLGVYSTAIYALKEFDLALIATIGAGVIVGFVVSSKAIRYVLSRFSTGMYAIIIGMIGGSIAVVYPGLPQDTWTIVFCVITAVVGFTIASLFGSRNKTSKKGTARE